MSRTRHCPALLVAVACAVVLTANGTAHAAPGPGSPTYSCSGLPEINGPAALPIEVELSTLGGVIPTGLPLANLPVRATPVWPGEIFTGAASGYALTQDLAGVSLRWGSLSIPVGPMSGTPTPPPPGGADLLSPSNGITSAAATAAPAPGVYDLGLVDGFTLEVKQSSNGEPSGDFPPMPCTAAAASPTQKVTVRKQTSSVKARVIKQARAGERPKVKVKVTRELGDAGTGKVVAKVKGKNVGKVRLKKGRATLVLKKLSAGKHKVELTYLGDPATDPVTKTVPLKVKR